MEWHLRGGSELRVWGNMRTGIALLSRLHQFAVRALSDGTACLFWLRCRAIKMGFSLQVATVNLRDTVSQQTRFVGRKGEGWKVENRRLFPRLQQVHHTRRRYVLVFRMKQYQQEIIKSGANFSFAK